MKAVHTIFKKSTGEDWSTFFEAALPPFNHGLGSAAPACRRSGSSPFLFDICKTYLYNI
jgi:hypothetical protein